MKKISIWFVLVLLGAQFSAELARSQSKLFDGELPYVPIASQKQLAKCNFENAQTLSLGQASIETQSDGTVILSGKNYEGKSWNSTYEVAPGAGCELWEAKLDANTKALFLVRYGMNSSAGWDTILSVLSFDEQGNPFPWEATGYVDVTQHGISNVVALNDARSVGIIVASRETGFIEASREWAHRDEFRLYKLTQHGVSEITGFVQGAQWPHSYASAKNQWSTRPAKFDLSVLPQGSNQTMRVQTITKLNGSDPVIVTPNLKIPFPEIFVVDNAAGRHIVSGPTLEDAAKLGIVKTSAKALGTNCVGDTCNPVVVWFK